MPPITIERLAEIAQIAQDAHCAYPDTDDGHTALANARELFNDNAAEIIADLLSAISDLKKQQSGMLDLQAEAEGLCRAISDGYPNPNIDHESFRVQVAVWAASYLENSARQGGVT